MTTRYIHSLNRSQPIMLSIARADTVGSGPGATIGPAMAFAWVAVNAIAGERGAAAGGP
ncbi:hypothetical protein QEZ40_003315 [Streptomyces katrae]|uniref:Uncharacterized protein n=1 Tax=Streptomyces katrae TaxID=68223 RepID=A0ABT7GXP4_9ACTN|nr:hypothetical protein [Streptomyces katrae]MDK9498363.1 hypothetical protein [Streptomyces katrae]